MDGDNWNLPPSSVSAVRSEPRVIKAADREKNQQNQNQQDQDQQNQQNQDQQNQDQDQQNQDQQNQDQQNQDDMKLHGFTLLVFCSALWVVASSSLAAAPPRCDATLEISGDASSLSGGNGNIHSRSLSPWKWTWTTVKDRIPSTIWEAQCTSSFCSGPNGEQTDGLDSVPIRQNILVLTRQDGGRCYTTSYRSVAVGCTCVWTKTSQN